MNHCVIHWFRQDFRMSDNPALVKASKAGPVIPLFIWDNSQEHTRSLGEASCCYLHEALNSLNKILDSNLVVMSGNAINIIVRLVNRYKIKCVYWNRSYNSEQVKQDAVIQSQLKSMGVDVVTENGILLWEPWEVEKKSGGNYRVFTPFYRKGCLSSVPPRQPIKKPQNIQFFYPKGLTDRLCDLKLLPNVKWYKNIVLHADVGEAAAQQRLDHFIDNQLHEYKKGRDFPAVLSTSRLSSNLRWGEISPNQVWYKIKKELSDQNTECYLSQLAWREFCYSLLYYYPSMKNENLKSKFNGFSWRKNEKRLTAWKKGMTGYPIVDAGMRELWQTGFMHNRVRMIVASFLVKNLNIHWREGEEWFWNCLLDADEASNCAGWQWVAGCGVDAAPFFRIFNPITQGKKFDPEGVYTRLYLPELNKLPDKYLFSPWEAPKMVLKKAGVKLGVNYPVPIVDLKLSRQQALAAYRKLT